MSRCSVCGENKLVADPSAIISLPPDEVSCSDLEMAGLNGLIPSENCINVQPFAWEVCACSNATTSPSVSPPPGQDFCSVCGQNSLVGNPDAIVSIPNVISCGALEKAGFAGQISEAQCIAVQPFVTDVCVCNDDGSSTEEGSNVGVIFGGVIGGAVGLLLIVSLVILLRKRRLDSEETAQTDNAENTGENHVA